LVVGVTDFLSTRLVPALRGCGLTTDEIVADRKVQEVVYLLERSGDKLGFKFKWEVSGPFSGDLADEIRELDRADVDQAAQPPQEAQEAIGRVELLMRVPEPVELSDEEWLRLVMCVDFVESRAPGTTENGGTPPFIRLNFSEDAIRAAREQAREVLAG
jgi:hypothetical protein